MGRGPAGEYGAESGRPGQPREAARVVQTDKCCRGGGLSMVAEPLLAGTKSSFPVGEANPPTCWGVGVGRF
jgi:hypothetical protein